MITRTPPPLPTSWTELVNYVTYGMARKVTNGLVGNVEIRNQVYVVTLFPFRTINAETKGA
jgi:hypothetical protein